MSLVPSGSSSGSRFAQQGTVDWVSLSKETVGFSVQVLSQLARGGVHPYTLVIGQHIGNNFCFSAVGRRNFTKALQELKYFKGFDDIIKFGFGVECLPRLLSTTEQGTLCAALCSALCEFYNEDVAAEVLLELAKLIQLPEEFNPSMLEWRSLLRVFQGVLSATHFPLIVEQFRQLLPIDNCRRSSHTRLGRHRHPRATTVSIANVLRALGEASREHIACVRVTGDQADLAWLGAVSIWLFGLRTTITVASDPDDQLVYTNCTDSDVQCSLVFLNTDDQSHGHLEVAKTFKLAPEESMFARSVDISPATGRVQWNQCLSFTFGPAFHQLLEGDQRTGTALGSAARVLDAYHQGMDLSERIGAYCNLGGALVTDLVDLLPELAVLRQDMERAANCSYADAVSDLESSWQSIKLACGCTSCTTDSSPSSCRYCLYSLLITILLLGCVLSSAHIMPDLYPTIQGLESFYWSIGSGFHETGILESILMPFKRTFRIPASSVETIAKLFSVRNMSSALHAATLQAFSGSHHCAAIAQSGICVYLHTLQHLPTAESFGDRVYVMPGKIEFKGHQYDYVTSRLDSYSHLSTELPVDALWDISLLVTPRMSTLDVLYRATTRNRALDFGAHDLVDRMDQILYTPRCQQRACAKVRKVELVGLPGANRADADDAAEVNHGHGSAGLEEAEAVIENQLGSANEDELVDRVDAEIDHAGESSTSGTARPPQIIDIANIGKHPFYLDIMTSNAESRFDGIIWKRDCCWDCCLRFVLNRPRARDDYPILILYEGALSLFTTPLKGSNAQLRVTL